MMNSGIGIPIFVTTSLLTLPFYPPSALPRMTTRWTLQGLDKHPGSLPPTPETAPMTRPPDTKRQNDPTSLFMALEFGDSGLLCLSMTQHEGSRLVPESPNL
jgi:hypothetical protein